MREEIELYIPGPAGPGSDSISFSCLLSEEQELLEKITRQQDLATDFIHRNQPETAVIHLRRQRALLNQLTKVQEGIILFRTMGIKPWNETAVS